MAERYCLCSDPDYCLRYSTAGEREAAIAYRHERSAPLPRKGMRVETPQSDPSPSGLGSPEPTTGPWA